MRIGNTLSRQPLSGMGFNVVYCPSHKFYHSIMKTRRRLKNQALIQEVISQISQQFVPKILDIKNGSSLFLLMHLFTELTCGINRPSSPFSTRSLSSAWMGRKIPLPTWPRDLWTAPTSLLVCLIYVFICCQRKKLLIRDFG